MRSRRIQRAIGSTIHDVVAHHTVQTSAALAYYFVLSIFPGLIALSAVLGVIPVPNLFGSAMAYLNRVLPAEGMHVVRSVLTSVLSANSRTWLSVGTLGLIWTTSSAFDAMIEALDMAYDVQDQRPIWKTRLLALGLAIVCGGLLLFSLAVMIVGPRFGEWVARELDLSRAFALVWPVLRWVLAIGFTVLAVEILYFLAPAVKQRFWATLPGAILFVVVGDALSSALGIYFRSFANFNRIYGTLGGFVAFMTWLYWTSFVLLVGAELNSELSKACTEESLRATRGPSEQRPRLDEAA